MGAITGQRIPSSQRTTPAAPVHADRTPGHPLLALQRTAGNQAVQRLTSGDSELIAIQREKCGSCGQEMPANALVPPTTPAPPPPLPALEPPKSMAPAPPLSMAPAPPLSTQVQQPQAPQPQAQQAQTQGPTSDSDAPPPLARQAVDPAAVRSIIESARGPQRRDETRMKSPDI